MRKSFSLSIVLLAACNPTTSVPPAGDGGADTGVPNLCSAPTGTGTKHMGDVTSDTTWAAADSPHIVPSSFKVAKGATLTIEPCAEVRIQATGITVDGKLVADGTASTPITITADDASKPFTYIRSFGSMDFANVTISHGGASDPNAYGMIDARADGTKPPQAVLRMVNVTLDGSGGYGVSLREGAAFTADSSGLTVKNAAVSPVRAEAPLAGSVPSGTYTGNGEDAIVVIAQNPLLTDSTWRARGVPYRIGDTKGNGTDLRIGPPASGPLATLTIESGVTVAVSKNGRILTNSTGSPGMATGALVATNAVFTSAEASPAAGDWVGLYLAGAPAAATRLDGVHVEYAGGPSYAKSFHCDTTGGLNEEEDAAIIILSGSPPGGAFVTNSTIASSAGYGIDRGWMGGPVDFTPTNTFQDVAKCQQSYPRPMSGNCPNPPPCP